MYQRLIMLVIAIVVFVVVTMASPAGKATGRVVDSEGAAIEARLLFHYDPSGQLQPQVRADVIRETDRSGHFDVSLDAGFYDMCVLAAAFTPECRKILVEDERAVEYSITMKADPLVIQQIGDRFFSGSPR
ncbi:MAG TPA: hypothetical protein VG900_06750 [Hyphomicrobiaceae bacterium]|jgi:hypothetical protein|nr:hypothetical protein [Hyphomicrobiaceae bacterium]